MRLTCWLLGCDVHDCEECVAKVCHRCWHHVPGSVIDSHYRTNAFARFVEWAVGWMWRG